MPEPASTASLAPPPLWPAELPDPQAASRQIIGPPRVTASAVLTGPTRLRSRARTAPAEYFFETWFTAEQMEQFEDWYRGIVRDADGEFYARWIGGARIVAFVEPYQYRALGTGYALTGHLIRTRIDTSACDAYLSSVFGAIYLDDGIAADVYEADLTASDQYVDDYDLQFIADHEC